MSLYKMLIVYWFSDVYFRSTNSTNHTIQPTYNCAKVCMWFEVTDKNGQIEERWSLSSGWLNIIYSNWMKFTYNFYYPSWNLEALTKH